MTTHRNNGYLEVIPDDNPYNETFDVSRNTDTIGFDMFGRTYRDNDNYNTRDNISVSLNLEDAIAVRDYLSEKILELERGED